MGEVILMSNLKATELLSEAKPKEFESKDIEEIMGMDVYFEGCLGFGDNFYQRPVIKHLSKSYKTVYLKTALPAAYWDIPNIKFISYGITGLRTHDKETEKNGLIYTKLPKGIEKLTWPDYVPSYGCDKEHHPIQVGYPGEELSNTEYIRRKAGIKEIDFTFQVKREWIDEARAILAKFNLNGKKLCIIRPTTVRLEWDAKARNPKPEYIQLLIDKYGEEYFFLSIANNEEGNEWMEYELKGIDAAFHRGELPFTTIFGLIKISDMVICYPGWMMLAAIAIRAKCFCLFGGMQKPEILLDKNMGLDNFEYIAPSPFCHCMKMEHNCNKKIPPKEIIKKFEALQDRPKKLKEVSIGVPPGVGDIHWIMMKMEAFKELNAIDKLKIAIHEDCGHRHSSEYLELLSFVDAIERRTSPFIFSFALCGGHGKPLYENEQGVDYMIELNSSLESGEKLDYVFPEYKTNWDIVIKYPEETRQFALDIKNKAGGRLVLIYTSSVSGNNKWAAGWAEKDWIMLIDKIIKATGCKPILIGAEWDLDYTAKLRAQGANKFMDYVGKTSLKQTLALIREADLLVAYPSGLAVMAVQFKTPCVMFWSIKGYSAGGSFKKEFMFSWLPPWARENGRYMPFIYGDGKTTVDNIWECTKGFLSKGNTVNSIKRYSVREYTKDTLIWFAEKGIGYFRVRNNDIYNEAYFNNYKKYEHSDIAEELNKFRIEIVNKYIFGTVLDIGIGCGTFIEKRGNCVGYDINSTAVKWLKANNLFFDIYQRNFNDIEGITFFDSLEHIKYMGQILEKVNEQIIVISIPIFNSCEHILKSKHFKKKEHYYYFTEYGFKGLADFYGFEIIEIRNDETRLGRDGILTFVLRRRKQ